MSSVYMHIYIYIYICIYIYIYIYIYINMYKYILGVRHNRCVQMFRFWATRKVGNEGTKFDVRRGVGWGGVGSGGGMSNMWFDN